ncbi:MAG: hypothetical protein GWP05_07915 [Anaerolineaceae bacterium]|nr:hypothetical protein [Anaerolineaceae bacterium]
MNHPVKVHHLLLALAMVCLAALTVSAADPIRPSPAPASPSAVSVRETEAVEQTDEEDEDLDLKPISEVSASDPFGRKAALKAAEEAAEAAAEAAAEENSDENGQDSENGRKGEGGKKDHDQPTTTAPLIRDGKRLFDREGTVRLVGNQMQLLLDEGNRVFVLHPTKSLQRVEDLSDHGRRKVRFIVSGLVCRYRGRNYLLLDSERLPQVVGPEPEAAADKSQAEQPGKSETKATTNTPVARKRDLPPQQIERDIPGRVKMILPPAGPPREGGRSSLLRQDKRLVDREGRIFRSNRQTYFVFDNGDKPIVLLPNEMLERMEDMADFGWRQMRFRVSGAATEYRGRNYLLMSKMLVIPKEIEQL